MKKMYFKALGIALIATISAVFMFGCAETVGAQTKDNKETKEGYQSFSGYLSEASTGEVLYSFRENEKHEIASMTKIMSNVIFFEEIASGRISLDEKVIISQTAAKIGGSTMFLDANTAYLVSDLLKGIIVASANDACVAMAERVSGSEETFTVKMNETAKALGMENTLFANSTGLPAASQYSTAKDVNIATRKLMQYPDYYKFSKVWFEKYTHPSGRVTELANTNKLIRFYPGCDGGKTGYTDNAKHCLSASAMRNGMRIVSTIIGSPDSKTRFKEVGNMLNFGFANYEVKSLISAEKPFEMTMPVIKGKQKQAKVGVFDAVNIVTKKNVGKFDFVYSLNENVKAPLKRGDIVGEVAIQKDGQVIKTVPIQALEDIDSATFIDYLRDIVKKW